MSIMYDHTLSVNAQNYQIRHQATRKVSCQHGDSRWPLDLPQEFVLVSMG